MLAIRKWIEGVLLSHVVKTSGCGSFVHKELSGTLVSWNREVTESSEVCEVAHRVQACVARDHEVIIPTFAEKLKANSEGFLTSRHHGEEQNISNATGHQRDHQIRAR